MSLAFDQELAFLFRLLKYERMLRANLWLSAIADALRNGNSMPSLVGKTEIFPEKTSFTFPFAH